MKALTVALNPAMDKTYIVDTFCTDRIHSVRAVTAVPGGKTNNAARVLRALGHSVLATGFVAGSTGQWIGEKLTELGIEVQFVSIPGETRTCLTIVDPVQGTTTELRERGPAVSLSAQERLLQLLPPLASRCKIAIVSGSLPPGVPTEFVGRVIHVIQAAGAPVVLDMSGAALLEGLRARHLIIKPNLQELSELAGTPVDARDAAAVARTLARRFQVDIVASLGSDGAVAARATGATLRVSAPAVRAVNPVGAGDSLVAGFASGFLQGLPLDRCVRLGVACGTASVLAEGVAVIRPDDVQRLMAEVGVSPM